MDMLKICRVLWPVALLAGCATPAPPTLLIDLARGSDPDHPFKTIACPTFPCQADGILPLPDQTVPVIYRLDLRPGGRLIFIDVARGNLHYTVTPLISNNFVICDTPQPAEVVESPFDPGMLHPLYRPDAAPMIVLWVTPQWQASGHRPALTPPTAE